MSGGVDSSACAVLLKEAGLDVVGVFMRNGVSAQGPAQEKSCCSASDARDASMVADKLGIPFYAMDYAEEFSRIMDYFAEEYRQGRTPNPCVLCNQDLKFGHLFKLAESVGADQVATGHYARVRDGQLLRAADADKDQTYYLFGVEREALKRVSFPLGEMTKAEVRDVARSHGLSTAEKAESMDICFVTSGDYKDVVRARGGGGKAGNFVDSSGKVLGEHDGVDGFTVGQRRGLPALGVPHYVQEIDASHGTVVLCQRDGLNCRQALVREVNWLVDQPGAKGMQAEVKIRARSAAVPAQLTLVDGDPKVVQVAFAENVQAVTPGQAAVFYQGDLVLGGGWLD